MVTSWVTSRRSNTDRQFVGNGGMTNRKVQRITITNKFSKQSQKYNFYIRLCMAPKALSAKCLRAAEKVWHPPLDHPQHRCESRTTGLQRSAGPEASRPCSGRVERMDVVQCGKRPPHSSSGPWKKACSRAAAVPWARPLPRIQTARRGTAVSLQPGGPPPEGRPALNAEPGDPNQRSPERPEGTVAVPL